jgi:plastocyanin
VALWTHGASGGPGQIFLRQFTEGPTFALNVVVSPPGAGRVVSTPIGIDCPDDTCSERFPSGQIVSLTPIAGPDHLFDKWFGACTGSGPCNVPMTRNQSVNASFVSAATLTVATDGLGTVAGTGIKCGGPGGTDCSEKYRLGTVVTLTVTLPVGTLFGGWGDACAHRGTNMTCPLQINGNSSVSVDFHQRVYRVTATLTNPAGTVVNGVGGSLTVFTESGPLFTCDYNEGPCSGEVEHGDRVSLVAFAAPGNKFLNYTGTLCGGRTTPNCLDNLVTGNHTVTGFIRGVTALFASKLGNGANKSTLKGPGLDCGLDCTGEAFTGTQVVITQTPGVGNRLVGFSGPPGCLGQVCSFLATGTNQAFDATYQLNQYRLTITGEGFGYTLSTDGGIDCGSVPGHSDCTEIYNHGDIVELTPYPGVDSRFVAWQGCSRVLGSICYMDMTSNRTGKKLFAAARTLFLDGSGNGRGRYVVPGQLPLDCQGNCSTSYLLPFNQTVVVTPTPAVGSNFVWDTGVCAGRGGSCSYFMGTNQSGSGRYRLNRHRLVVTNRTNGSVESVVPFPDSSIIDCGNGDNICTSEQDFGTRVHVEAEANEGYFFVNWTGTSPCAVGARATNSSCDFVLQGNNTLTPNYRARTVVTIDKEGNGAGLVTGPGFSCGTDCSEAVFDAKRITLLATASLGSRFDGFTGACFSNSSTTCNFLPTGNDQTVFATFSLLPFTFTVTSRNQGVVESINGPADPIDCGGDCSSTLLFGTRVVLQAFPLPGFVFVNWTGDAVCSGKTNSTCAFDMPARTFVVTPNYRPRTLLSVVKPGNGDGLVTGPGINCGPDCAEPIFDGKAVTLIARAAVGSIFEGFGVPCPAGNSSTCTFTPAGANQSISATFTLLPFTLTVTSRNQGVVQSNPLVDPIDCGGDCSATLLFGTDVVLQAFPLPGFVFVNWTGDAVCAGKTSSTCAFDMPARNVVVTPNYRPRTLVTVVKDGTGAGTVTGMGFSCGTDCSESVFDGKAVTLTAAAAIGSRVGGFHGACVSNSSTCTFIPAGGNQTVFATFILQQFVLGVTNRANGSVTGTVAGIPDVACGDAGSDCSEVVDFNSLVVLVAAPAVGTRFVNWTGDAVCAGKTNSTCAFPMPARNVSITPNYQLATLVRVFPDGQGTTTAGPPTARTINCVSGQAGVTGDCTETIVNGAALTLTATPATGWDFAFWDDASCGGVSGGTCTFTPAGDSVDVYPVFLRERRVVTVTVSGNGSVTSGFDFCDSASSPCALERLFGDVVVLSASPAPGNQVVWTGCTVNGSTCSLVLNTATNRTVNVTFQPPTVQVGGAAGFTTFSQQHITIQAGQTVRWNWGSSPHNVVSGNTSTGVADGVFCSTTDTNCSTAPLTGPGTVYSHTFNTPGTFTYFCRQHRLSGMTGSVTVLE